MDEKPIKPAIMDSEETAEMELTDSVTDSPFDKDAFNDILGIGGGAGSRSRFARRRAAIAALGGELPPGFNTEAYDHFDENPFRASRTNPLSTFGIDVDTASYANLRRFLREKRRPPKGAVRIEEMINYFDYSYPEPRGEQPLAVHVEVSSCPWKPGHLLARIGLKAKSLDLSGRPRARLTFLLDVSGSMDTPRKLPLLKSAMKLLVEQLEEGDKVAIAVYAGAAGLVLPPTDCATREPILAALDRLEAGGSTAGGDGIRLAYRIAKENYLPGALNRVVLCTDGDFNVGVTNQSDLVELIQEEAKAGVFLTVLGFGMGNYKDSTLEKLADKGNGNYAYIDSLSEARKVLVRELGGTLVTVAKDVKLQIEFNPSRVQAWRLIGYENRLLNAEDFKDDKKDAGEVGAGHCVTALYQLVPAGVPFELPGVDPLKYQAPAEGSANLELMNVKLRYKLPDADTSVPMDPIAVERTVEADQVSADFRLAAVVAACGMLLRESPHKGEATWESVLALAGQGLGQDRHGYRAEFLELMRKASDLK